MAVPVTCAAISGPHPLSMTLAMLDVASGERFGVPLTTSSVDSGGHHHVIETHAPDEDGPAQTACRDGCVNNTPEPGSIIASAVGLGAAVETFEFPIHAHVAESPKASQAGTTPGFDPPPPK